MKTAEEYLSSIGRMEIQSWLGPTGEYIITPQQMEEYADQFRPKKPAKLPLPATIMQAICDMYSVTHDQVLSRSRKIEIIEARQLLSVMIRFGLKKTLHETSDMLGGFDHVTILHSTKKVSERFLLYKDYNSKVDSMVKAIFPPDCYNHIIARLIDPHLDRKVSMAKHIFA